ncbi:MAG: tryptophan--tRNA ligase [Dehalococcoidia bacterium]|jgi:tryptophanyl-tRNA synthetase|nr:tryptophan--tRNA ligase [Chloroflexota bacterium]MDP6055203.1 tryptophan--tRNA ligase [Dehalococcoidia bacterium]MDP7090893.1 tryptophan--tRNA ligase [Dehalococcoidia bacterium]MDP7484840.1 tryptophan--tRNA ligase [Dehalococcoidia bacterium]|tara:strand:+ start:1225 stop:2247 length:1023 start_codon:yes stop_codon:yes gene_type:complete
MAAPTKKKRILTGVRPTGALHVGHYVGALHNWIELQHQYETYFLIADYQALGDHLHEIDMIRESVLDVTLDWLAVGLDPEKSSFVVQSYVPEFAELTMLLSFITPLGMLERNPTLKGELDDLDVEQRTVGFYNYPMSQVADILLPRADLVPVGDDQLPHIEMTREVARKFNRMFGKVFPESDSLIGKVPRLSGTDGQGKMSKSKGNVIMLSDDEKTVTKKVRGMFTDPNRIRADIPGKVEGNPVFEYHDAFNPDTAQIDDFKARYRGGTVGDVEVKMALAEAMNNFLDPIREKRAYYQANMNLVEEAIMSGVGRMRTIAAETMEQVRDAMRISSYTKNWK